MTTVPSRIPDSVRRLLSGAAALFLLPAWSEAQTQCQTNGCWVPSGTADIANANSGNVGIGLTGSGIGAFKLDVLGDNVQVLRATRTSNVNNLQAAFTLRHKLTTAGALADGFGPATLFYGVTSTNAETLFSRIGGVKDSGTIPGGNVQRVGQFVFKVATSADPNANTLTPALVIRADEVYSNVQLTAKYSQDLAEWVTVRGHTEPGMVVVVNRQAVNAVSPSAQSYDTGVAGVISAKPAIILGEEGEDKATVATTGRVKVKVDANKAPIRIGDLLVTSDREGYAMRSEPVEIAGVKMHRPGTLIGKALEPLKDGEGEVLVLLSLQ